MPYLNLEAKEFTPEKIEAMKEEYKAVVDSDVDDQLLCEFDDTKTKIDEIKEDGTLFVTSETPLGYISFEVKLDLEDQIQLMEMMVKRLNKFKTLLESIK